MLPDSQAQAAGSLGAQPEFYTPDQASSQAQRDTPELALERLRKFADGFENWVFTEFYRAANVEVPAGADPVGLTMSLLAWVNELREFGLHGALQHIGGPTAARLGCLLNYALDKLEIHYRSVAASPATMMLALSPLDDLLVFLSLAARQPRTSATAGT